MSSKTFVVRSTWRILCVLVCASLIVSTQPPVYARSALPQANVERLASAAQPLKAVRDDQPSTTTEASDWSQGISLLPKVSLSLQSAVPITYGQTMTGTILGPGQVVTYTFTASAGDKVLVRMSHASGSLWPGVRVYGPDGTKLCEQISSDSQTAEIASCSLPSTGTYTILAYDGLYGVLTGDYYLYLQRLNNPGSPVSITFGQTLPGSIPTPAEMDTYTFAASAGDKVLVRMSKPSQWNLWPGVRVYGPDGTKLCEQHSPDSATAEIASCSLPSTGRYTILAYDSLYGTGTADYYLYLQRLNNPGSPVSIAFGQTLSGSIMTPAEMDTYTFAASAGDKVLVRMSKSSGNIFPGIRVYSPDGTQLCEASSSATAVIASCTLTSTGTYSILAYDSLYGTGTADYYLYLQQSNNPGNPVSITFGVPQEIDVTSDLPAWFQIEVMSNTANLFLTLQKYSSWSGELKLYSGTQVLSSTSGYADQILRWPSPALGKYLVEVSGSGSGRLTAYTALPELPLGQWVVGSIYRQGGSAWYQFTVPSGQSSLFIRVETIGLFSRLYVYRGALGGTLVGSASGPSMNLTISSPQPSTYYVHLTDSAWIQGSSQTHDHMIRADTVPIEPPPCTTPLIASISPSKGGTAGPVTIQINGQCLVAHSTVYLTRNGFNNVTATQVISVADGRTLAATFDLSATVPGNWNLVVTNSYSQSVTAPMSFTVESGGEIRVSAEIIGRQQIRAGRPSTYVIRVANTGAVDTGLSFVFVTLPQNITCLQVKWRDIVVWDSTENAGSPVALVIPPLSPGQDFVLEATLLYTAAARQGNLDPDSAEVLTIVGIAVTYIIVPELEAFAQSLLKHKWDEYVQDPIIDQSYYINWGNAFKNAYLPKFRPK